MANLTPEQSALLELLAPGAYAWATLDTAQQQLLSATLRPAGSFTDEQRSLLADWYLIISPEQLAAANATLAPLRMAIASRTTTDGRTTINADLLTDCVQPGDTYRAIASTLAQLKLIRLPPTAFPAPTAP